MANEVLNKLIFEALKAIQAQVVRVPKLVQSAVDLQTIVRGNLHR